MTNIGQTRGFRLSTLRRDFRVAFHHGWVDAQNRLPWRPSYEAATINLQWAYEYGRLSVVNVIAAGLRVPAWRGDKEGVGPVERTLRRAWELTGDPLPPARARA